MQMQLLHALFAPLQVAFGEALVPGLAHGALIFRTEPRPQMLAAPPG
jgi:hypothetical protein